MKTRVLFIVFFALLNCHWLVAEEVDLAALAQAREERSAARDKFEKVIEKCMDSDKANGYAHIDHNDSSFGIQVMCKEPKAAVAYLKAASEIFDYQDEPYTKDRPDIIRRVFDDKRRTHLCFFRGKAEDEHDVTCYFKLTLNGFYKQKIAN